LLTGRAAMPGVFRWYDLSADVLFPHKLTIMSEQALQAALALLLSALLFVMPECKIFRRLARHKSLMSVQLHDGCFKTNIERKQSMS
jgi:hypothetical protein